MTDPAPLILSAVLDEPVQRRLDALRRAHFPPERNHLDAHVTLFHQLPGAEVDAVAAAVAGAAREHPEPDVEVTGVRSLGRGVAVTLASPALAAVRAALAREWAPWLTPQDRTKRGDLHVTVQNKVTPAAARALLARLSPVVVPERTRAVALALWRYRDGPWEPVDRFAFAPADPSTDPSTGPSTGPSSEEPAVPDPATGTEADPAVHDVPERSRFEIQVDGRTAGFAEYRMKKPGLIVFTHTVIADAYEGRGLGSTLVRAALDAARDRGLAVRPDCPFVRAYVARHPDDYLALVPEDLRPRLGL
jgi:predicted GNAT family acetyltransferase/2'-5' RNA ligase